MPAKEYIVPGMKITGHGLWLEKEKILIVSDFHLGMEESLNRQGVMIPRINYRKIKIILQEMLNETGKPEKIIINGDFKHEFGAITSQEWDEGPGMLQFLKENSGETILIRGNHDLMLGPVAKWTGIRTEQQFYLPERKLLICHGDIIPETQEYSEAEKIIIGNEHPAVRLREKQSAETYKCFLRGKFNGKTLVVMPSMNQITKGTDILSGKMISPFLQQELGEFDCWLIEDTSYYFGKVRELQ